MAEDRQENGTEEPTQRRRERAREEGQVVQSPEVASAFALLVAGLILLWCGRSMGGHLTGGLRTWLTETVTTWSPQMDFVVVRWLSWQSLAICGLPLLLMLLVSFSIALIQTGPIFRLTPLSIKFEKLAPASNWKKLMSLDNGLKSLLAIFESGGRIRRDICVFLLELAVLRRLRAQRLSLCRDRRLGCRRVSVAVHRRLLSYTGCG